MADLDRKGSFNGKVAFVTGAANGIGREAALAYHFTGPAPDSMRADPDGNL